MPSLENYPIRQPKDLSLSLLAKEKILLVEGIKKRFYFPLQSVGFRYNTSERKVWLIKSKNQSKAFFNFSKILLAQVFLGVLLSYRRQLNIVGIGYQAQLEKEKNKSVLVLKLGFSHLVRIQIPSLLEVFCPKPRILVVKGINLQRVNNFSLIIRQSRFPSAYKEKGIYFAGEQLRLKQGKKT